VLPLVAQREEVYRRREGLPLLGAEDRRMDPMMRRLPPVPNAGS
jgi:hypothetical protein